MCVNNWFNCFQIVIFGGFDGVSYLDDLYVLDVGKVDKFLKVISLTETCTWSIPKNTGSAPSPRAGHTGIS